MKKKNKEHYAVLRINGKGVWHNKKEYEEIKKSLEANGIKIGVKQ